MKLDHYIKGRDNNFNLLRFIAAYAVLFSHSFALTTGIPDLQPLSRHLGVTPGTIAVDIFFVVSGFLVTASLLNRGNLVEFCFARVLRIFPALIVMVAVTAILGAALSSYSTNNYFSDQHFWLYVVKNMTVVTGLHNELPGLFEHNPMKSGVNGSLWTITYELKMYILLAVLWLLLGVLKTHRQEIFSKAIIAIALASFIAYLLKTYSLINITWLGDYPRLVFMFFSGALFFVLRNTITLSLRFFLILLAALIVAGQNKVTFDGVYAFVIAYIVIFAAYAPKGRIRIFNKFGDYSYGIYIYAFPIQQGIVAATPGISIEMHVFISTALTLPIAIASWHLIEAKALLLKSATAEILRQRMPFLAGT